jgi:hypothetical protein
MSEQKLLVRPGNPLLEAWHVLKPVSSYGLIRFDATDDDIFEAARILDIDDEELRRFQRDHSLRFVGSHLLRREATIKYAWAIPDDAALDMIGRYGPVVEVGAGTGYWAGLLAERGIDVVALDLWPAGHPQNFWHSTPGVYYPVEEAPVEAAARHPNRTLLLCWPPYAPSQDVRMSPPEDPENWVRKDFDRFTQWSRPNEEPDMALMALLAYEAAGGQRVVYIGEGAGGATAGPMFHALVGQGCDHWGEDDVCECPEARWTELDSCAIPQWDGMHDHLWVYERLSGIP